MKIVVKNIVVRNEVLTLTNQRAIYWQEHNTLILSDIHIGKTAHFRKHGIPMPDDILQKDLNRLKQLIHHFKPSKILIVGDLFHAQTNSNTVIFKDWLWQFEDVKFVLIKGNHDRISKHLMDDLNIIVEEELIVYPFGFIHDNAENRAEAFVISGHIHPGVLIRGKGKQKIKLPCYQLTKSQLILPAFSLFTGLNYHDKPDNSVNYAFTDSEIFQF